MTQDGEMNFPVQGAGLGLRRGLMNELDQQVLARKESAPVDFLEIAPENWIGIGGRLGRRLRAYSERFPMLCHGLSLSIGGPDPLDENLVRSVRDLMKEHGIRAYSEHLSYCSAQGHLYDLMPIPFTAEAVDYVAERILRVQDILGQRLIIENVSSYAEPGKEMAESEFVCAVLEKADCQLLLDVNNIYVNCHNHGGDPLVWMQAMPTERIAYLHIAGHYQESPQLLIDTHGKAVKDAVWDLLQATYRVHGVIPTLLERDFNFPPLTELLDEVGHIRAIQQAATQARERVYGG
jgi:uncharacterized protein